MNLNTTTYQQTIIKAVSLAGVGLHTGKQACITFKPAPVNHGIKFKRVDLPQQPVIKADVANVVDTQRSTSLAVGDAKVGTVEHVLAALTGLQIDNVLVEIDKEELPIMDGSAQPFVDLLLAAGIEQQDKERFYFPLRETIRYYDAEKDVEIIAMPAEKFQLTVMIDFNSKVLGQQYATLQNITHFKTDIASARTFCFFHELVMLQKHNLIKGGALSNAIVIVDNEPTKDELAQVANLFNQPEITVHKDGYLNNLTLRYTNEPARHKLLDVVGDLALIGTAINAKIFASKPGHRANVAFAKLLKQHIRENKHLIGMPMYDPTKAPAYDVNAIMDYLPHRFPFLLIDKILEMDDKQVVGLKNVSFNEPFFQGHFPGQPVMPGVLIIEAMAQAGGIMLLQTVPDPANYVTYFLKIDKAKFRHPVVPGDTIIFKLELLSPIRRGICEMHGAAYVGKKIAAEAILTAKIMQRT